MNYKEAKERIEKLKKEINKYREAYHVYNKELISEQALDSLKHELYKLEEKYPDLITADSPSQRVAGKVLDKFRKVKHRKRMLSLEDLFTFDEIDEWYQRILKLSSKKKLDFYCELKIDGLALSLIYKKGLLVEASTRGDGLVGEDVLNNVKTIESIPLKINSDLDYLELRGEVYIDKKNFERINKLRKKNKEKLFANPRNLAAGTLRQLDPKKVAERKLSFMAYSLESDLGQKTHLESHQLLQKLSFKIGKHNEYCANIEEVKSFCKKWAGAKREKLEYQIDGVVIMLNDESLYSKLGVVGKAPRYAIAYKFPAQEKTTIVQDVKIQIGRTGALTPVAILEPVFLDGSTITRATLHNFDEIRRLSLMINDTVIIQKAGDVIPKIVKVLKELRPQNAKAIKVPKKCPFCSGPLKKDEKETIYYCINPDCYSKQREKLIHFVKEIGIDGLGEANIDLFMQYNLLNDLADIYSLKEGDLLELPRFAEKKVNKILESIEKHKKLDLLKFLTALGIRYIGEESSAVLIKYYLKDLKNITDVYEFWKFFNKKTTTDFLKISGIGEKVSQSLFEYFHNEKTEQLFIKFKQLGVSLFTDLSENIGKLNSLSFVISGTMKSMKRDELKKLIIKMGGDLRSAISKNVDYLILGDNPGSKLLQAKKLGVKIIKEDEFMKLIQ